MSCEQISILSTPHSVAQRGKLLQARMFTPKNCSHLGASFWCHPLRPTSCAHVKCITLLAANSAPQYYILTLRLEALSTGVLPDCFFFFFFFYPAAASSTHFLRSRLHLKMGLSVPASRGSSLRFRPLPCMRSTEMTMSRSQCTCACLSKQLSTCLLTQYAASRLHALAHQKRVWSP